MIADEDKTTNEYQLLAMGGKSDDIGDEMHAE